MYSRSYEPEYTEKEMFLYIVQEYIMSDWEYLHKNNYPYDLKDGKKVKVDHWTLWHDDYTSLEHWISFFAKDSYIVQENPTEDKSVPEIPHLHFIKEIK